MNYLRMWSTYLALAGCVCCAQVAKEANDNYRDPAGRSRILSTLTDAGRDARQRPKELVAQLGIKPGMSVADIGTAGGYMLPHLAEATGPAGTIYAEDIFPDFLEAAKKRASSLKNVTYVLGNEKSVKLPASSIDLALILDAYHHFDYPAEMLASLRTALRPGGRIAVVEFHRNEKSMGDGRAMKHIRATKEDFVKEIELNGFRAVEVKDFTPEVQWLGIFEKR